MRLNLALPAMLMATLAGANFAMADDDMGLKEGAVEFKSIGPIAFGDDGILFAGDSKGAAVVAIATEDGKGDAEKVSLNIPSLNAKIAEQVGCAVDEVKINDMAVNPASGNIFFSVMAPSPAIIKVDATGKLSKLPLEKVKFAKVELADAPEDKIVQDGRRARNRRDEAVTDLAFVDGRLLVAGLSKSDAPSTVRELKFPFVEQDQGTTLEIYHGAHGRVEDYAPVRTFIPFIIDGEATILAGFTCTPLVRFSLSDFAPGKKVRGTTVAELGNRNQPLDMIAYEKEGETYLLSANTTRGVMKISTTNINRKDGIEKPVENIAGQEYETIKNLKGVVQLDKLGANSALILAEGENGSLDLTTIELP